MNLTVSARRSEHDTSRRHFFLCADSTPVGYMCVTDVDNGSGDTDGAGVVTAMEVRDIFRGYGYARETACAVSQFYPNGLFHIGEFTRAGNARASHLFPALEPDARTVIVDRGMDDNVVGVNTFVRDWEKMETVFA